MADMQEPLMQEVVPKRGHCSVKLTVLSVFLGLCFAMVLMPLPWTHAEEPDVALVRGQIQPARAQQFMQPMRSRLFTRQQQVWTLDRLTHCNPLTRATMTEDAEKIMESVNDYAKTLDLEQSSAGDGAAAVEFPPPLTGSQRLVRALTFYSRVLPVLFRYKYMEVKLDAERNLLGKDITEKEECEMWGEIDEWGSSRIYDTIADLKGFYVKTGQVISTRTDLFTEAYTDKFKQLQDGLEPMPAELVRAVVQQELLGGEPLSELFADFDDKPLGAASIAQVHKATLLDGRTVAVKVQRPNIEPKLRGDIANLLRISKQLREQLPVDYYTVFRELGDVLNDELNFFHEAQAMKKIAAAVSYDVNGEPSDAPLGIPLPAGELVSQRVLVMDYVEGVPLNRLSETMKKRGIDPDSPESKIAGIRILDSLSEAFERMIFGAGFIHGDPHPGNIFVQEGAKVSLIDCGQVKKIPRSERLRLAKSIVKLAEYQKVRRNPKSTEAQLKEATRALAQSAFEFGLEFGNLPEGTDMDELAASVALVLFGDRDIELPGGYSAGELDDNSPIKLLTSFPQELVLLGRATILLKGISSKLDVPFSLAEAWAPACEKLIAEGDQPKMPLWGKQESEMVATMATADDEARFRMRDAIKPWAVGKVTRGVKKAFKWLPEGAQTALTARAAEQMQREREKKMAGSSA
eukprot:gnl/TRDRNA2_/TRDRNA2_135695_c0_seq1.p1 gnl/TRDRNA2_/TRDRNA2_135695_c0~~gnl/TRDRNA2_/TRDRNA2_135695_c0_seq1.p1  ORF type:complete len:690 (+),score=178.84 gnl/TRDRNA2_/TRDRNA2_135695_c0_seq1:46-2115(+)